MQERVELSEVELKERLSPDTKKLVGIVRNCAQIALAVRSSGQMQTEDIELKGYLTEGDKAIERYFAETMPKVFPGVLLISEEAEKSSHSSIETLNNSSVAILDDIDGTRVYAHSEGFWSIILGLVKKGVLVSGVTMQPDLGNITISERGVGTFFIDRNGQVHVPKLNPETDLSKVKIGVGAVNADPATRAEAAPLFAELHKKSAGIISMESTGYEMALITRGFLSGYVHPGAKSWDKSAGMSHVEAQGGIATNFPNRDRIFDPGLIVSANPQIYDQIAELAYKYVR